MRSLAVLIVIFLMFVNESKSQEPYSDVEISILSCSPGQELYSSFGHSALYVKSEQLGFDHVFNYGTFSFDEPNFYLKFMKGFMKYKLSLQSYHSFLLIYKTNKQLVVKQTLNLSPKQIQNILVYLQWNSKKENRAYMYDFFNDNCSSRLTDILISKLKNNVEFDKSFNHEKYTYRELVEQYTSAHPWTRMGINLLFGQGTDRPVTWNEIFFLPNYQMQAIRKAQVYDGKNWVPLLKKEEIIQPKENTETENLYFTPALIFWLLFGVAFVFTAREIYYHKSASIFDNILFSMYGFAGIFLVVMWAFTEHYVTEANWNILWLIPTHLIAIFLRKFHGFSFFYFSGTAIIAAFLLIFFPWLPQKLDTDFIPLILIMLMRSTHLVISLKKQH